ncbi:MAG TPA: DUF3883 domain-containing protein [Sphingobacteriaceae bacterium]
MCKEQHRYAIFDRNGLKLDRIEKDGWELHYRTTSFGPPYDRIRYAFVDPGGKEIETWKIAWGNGHYLSRALRRLNTLIEARPPNTPSNHPNIEFITEKYFFVEYTHKYKGSADPGRLDQVVHTPDMVYTLAVYECAKCNVDGADRQFYVYGFFDRNFERIAEIELNGWKITAHSVVEDGCKVRWQVCDNSEFVQLNHVTDPNGEELANMLTILENLSNGTADIDEVQAELTAAYQQQQKVQLKSEKELQRAQILSEINECQQMLSELLKKLQMLDGPLTTTTLGNSDFQNDVGAESESYLNSMMTEKYGADRVEWLNELTDAKLPYDFIIRDPEGNVFQYVDCKGTYAQKPTFYMTANEWRFFLENKDHYQVYRVFNTQGAPTHTCIPNLFTAIETGRVVPYSNTVELIDKERVFLTLI